jgi:hypothetical protein
MFHSGSFSGLFLRNFNENRQPSNILVAHKNFGKITLFPEIFFGAFVPDLIDVSIKLYIKRLLGD